MARATAASSRRLPSQTVTAWPPSATRSPSRRMRTMPPRAEACSPTSSEPAEALGPERGQHAVRRTGDRILVHPDGRGEEAAHAVDALAVARRGDGDAAGIERGQGAQVRLQRPDRGGRAELHDEVEAAPADGVDLGRPERPGERVVVGGRRRGKGREVHLDPAVGFLAAGEHATEGVEGRVATQHMGRGQGGVAAQGDLGRRREPSQVERPVAPLHEERRLGEVHLRGDVLHPDGVGWDGRAGTRRRGCRRRRRR